MQETWRIRCVFWKMAEILYPSLMSGETFSVTNSERSGLKSVFLIPLSSTHEDREIIRLYINKWQTILSGTMAKAASFTPWLLPLLRQNAVRQEARPPCTHPWSISSSYWEICSKQPQLQLLETTWLKNDLLGCLGKHPFHVFLPMSKNR